VLDEQALTNRPLSSSANAVSDMIIFFFILVLSCLLFCRGYLSVPDSQQFLTVRLVSTPCHYELA
jgi:hypothetical protein